MVIISVVLVIVIILLLLFLATYHVRARSRYYVNLANLWNDGVFTGSTPKYKVIKFKKSNAYMIIKFLYRTLVLYFNLDFSVQISLKENCYLSLAYAIKTFKFFFLLSA